MLKLEEKKNASLARLNALKGCKDEGALDRFWEQYQRDKEAWSEAKRHYEEMDRTRQLEVSAQQRKAIVEWQRQQMAKEARSKPVFESETAKALHDFRWKEFVERKKQQQEQEQEAELEEFGDYEFGVGVARERVGADTGEGEDKDGVDPEIRQRIMQRGRLL